MNLVRSLISLTVIAAIMAGSLTAQSRRSQRSADTDGSIFSVTAARAEASADPIRVEDLFLFESGVQQKIKNLVNDPSPARILILVDNSQTLPATVAKMKEAVMEFAYEIFEGDQIFVIAYDEKPEIIQEWSDDPKKIEKSLEALRKRGNPHLFDAIDAGVSEVLLPLMPGTRKTAIVMIGDGLDRGSKISFDRALAELQNENVTFYALQMPDRTGGAYRRDQPKANAVVTRLTEETGGLVFPFEDAQAAAKAICDELRKNRYLLSYQPTNTSSFESRRLFIDPVDGIKIRHKTAQPPNIK
jgi:Ca-activated chloride channel homolog